MHRKSGRSSRFSFDSSRGRNRADRRHASVTLRIETLEERLPLTTLPTGFFETHLTYNSTLSRPTAIEISPIGELWVLEQTGRVQLVRDDGTTHTVDTLTVDSSGERGLLGIAFDPSYDGAGPNTDYVNLYYTVPRVDSGNPANNQLGRFEVSGAGTTTPTFTSGTIIRDLPPEDEDGDPASDGDTIHNGGAIHFGSDGKLYLAVGDHNYDTTPQSAHVSQILSTPFGKILRLNPDGSNPSDTPNPFYTGSATDWEGSIWALGLRNPYTFAFEAGTGKMFINDVGETVWEEINEGEAAANYGWAGSTSPLWEGFEPTATWTNYRDPQMAYDHSGATAPSPASAAITGGAFYPAGSQFGGAYAGKYFYADWGGNYIRVFDPDDPGSAGTPDTSTSFASSLTTSNPVDLKVDAAGNLYYVARGGFGANTGEIYRISANHVAARNIFYNNSAFDLNSTAINSDDDTAIDTSKTALLPGITGAFVNATPYTKGVNGVMVDLAGTGDHTAITVADFVFKVGNNNTPSTWAAAPAPTAVSVRVGAGVLGSDRVEITWADGAITNTWLEVQVLATANTDLADLGGAAAGIGDVFFYGNKVANNSGDLITSVPDAGSVFLNFGVATVTNVFDHDKSGVVSVPDAGIAFTNFGAILGINVAVGGPFAPGGGEVSPATAGGGAAGLSSGLASSSSSDQSVALPASVSARLETASSGSGVVATYSQLLEEAGDDGDDGDDGGVDDELLAALAGG